MHFQRNIFVLLFCISNVISSTSPWGESVSKTFGSADHPSSIFSPKKDICDDDYVLIEDGQMSLCFDKTTGKRCIMLSAKKFTLTFDSPYFWEWISIPESRFGKVPILIFAIPFKINGVMKTRFLSFGTRYAAYVVYKVTDEFRDLQRNVGTGFIGHGTPQGYKWERQYLTTPEERQDGWMEVKFGEFFNDEGLVNDEEITFFITEIDYSYWKLGFMIQGIEFRPIYIAQVL